MKRIAVAVAVIALASGCLDKAQNDSIRIANDAVKAHGAKQWDTVIERGKKALEKWPENLKAIYVIGDAYRQKKEYKDAVEYFQKSVKLDEDEPMYHLLLGMSEYQKTVTAARQALADKKGVKIDQISDDDVDLSSANFGEAEKALKQAIKLNTELWRAHYFLGAVYRDQGKAKEAATELTEALKWAPPEPAPWIALSDLYMRWDYIDAAITVAEEGLKPGVVEVEQSYLWYMKGFALESKGNYDAAIKAYDSAIQAKADNRQAKFQRGQAYYRKKDYTNAKKDLDEFAKSTNEPFLKAQASRFLMEIAAKTASQTNGGTPTPKLSPEEMVKEQQKKKKGK